MAKQTTHQLQPASKSGDCTVVCVLNEPLLLTLRFVAWYLELGAAKIVLYFDDPEDPAIPILEREVGVECIRCTAQFWHSLGIAPEARFTKRQMAALTHGYSVASTPWFLAVDADELVYFERNTLHEFAAAIPGEILAFRFATAEAVEFNSGGQYFRVPMSREAVRRVYGEKAALFLPRKGLVGHADGKSLTRTALQIQKVRPHWIVGADGNPIRGPDSFSSDGSWLLHYFDSGYENWRRKLSWRLRSWSFATPLVPYFEQDSDLDQEPRFRSLYENLHRLEPDVLQRLIEEGGCLLLDIDSYAASVRRFGQFQREV